MTPEKLEELIEMEERMFHGMHPANCNYDTFERRINILKHEYKQLTGKDYIREGSLYMVESNEMRGSVA